MTDTVSVEHDGNIAVITLNRPDKLNALSSELMADLVSALRKLKANRDVAVVILTGAGRAFSAGLDLDELSEDGLDNFSLDGDYDLQAAVLDFDRPIIGAINGVAATGGFELALWCDLLIASENARFADTHARVGVLPGWGLSQRLSRVIGIYRARELSFTGNFLSAQKADEWGLVNRVVPAEDLLPTCKALANDMVNCNQTTLLRYKRVINEGYAMDLAGALKYERLGMDLHSAGQASDATAGIKESVMNRARSKE